jgi:nicotinate-nucleotide pyrophosphorylase (carboxylating)
VIDLALAEDVGPGDITTDAIVPASARGVGAIVVREPGVVCGLDVALTVLQRLDPGASIQPLLADGDRAGDPPGPAAHLTGSLRALLTAERTMLNLLQRLSGIATTTRAYVEAVGGTGVAILDTRKTAPGLRTLDKWAVRCGGGENHRAGLYDALLVKDNHVVAAGGIGAAIRAVRERYPGRPVEVEVDTLSQLDEALAESADTILLDNMDIALLRASVRRAGGRTRLEASGGITLRSVRAVAETGVDAISVGALTHSVRALDVALEVTPWQQ